MHSYSLFPLLLACDEEGGWQYTFLKGNKEITPERPENIGKIDNPNYSFKCGSEVGKLMADAHLQITISPVVDLKNDDDRYFSMYPDVIIRNVRKYIEGMHQQGVYASIKHFPGVGSGSRYDNLRPFIELKDVADLITIRDELKYSIEIDGENMQQYAVNQLKFNGVFIMEGPIPIYKVLDYIRDGYNLIWVEEAGDVNVSMVDDSLLAKINANLVKVMRLKFPFKKFYSTKSLKDTDLYKLKEIIERKFK